MTTKVGLVVAIFSTLLGVSSIPLFLNNSTNKSFIDNEETRTFNTQSVWVYSVAISPDGQTLVTGNYNKSIKVWNFNTGKLIHRLQGHGNSVASVAISPDGQTLASGS
ncbi:WD40 repeat domain-containing protein [Umezakia ovalisporum]|jgi:WD40 repeat protein|uniref:WD40 repeat domain-containing protein n=1 Tax=Umezakia ovalisporum TaxID=75695 RepID=UPI0024750172|nr:hypothetical protein [Umezakia ovalisporum]MDH6067131.1 hypothetical protein [Umezakia ovalisporum APH033B]MDH6077127.1 hypothetical protein [Umezakia ovalisporum FSS-45]MDH6084071.1 hypothetical protein [Umezakia ovalisporum TAC611]MDH6087286.1 hypothetical protein [Umezakia ovalisporum Ak1311]